MNNHTAPEPIRRRRGVFYHSHPNNSGFGEFNITMLLEDISLRIMPIGGRSSRPGFKVSLCPPNNSAKSIITAGIDGRYSGNHLSDSLYHFFSSMVAELCASDRAVYEIVYLEERETKKIIGFELAFISNNQLTEKGGQFFQLIPPEIAEERNIPKLIPLIIEDLIIFKVPKPLEQALRDTRQNLAQLDKLQFPMMMSVAMQKNIPYDFKAHERSMKLALLEAVKPIGWTARGAFNDSVLSYYWVYLSLTFEKFIIQLRESLLKTLNNGIQRIGHKVGFDSQIKIDGLPTLADIDTVRQNLNLGKMPFTEIMKTLTER